MTSLDRYPPLTTSRECSQTKLQLSAGQPREPRARRWRHRRRALSGHARAGSVTVVRDANAATTASNLWRIAVRAAGHWRGGGGGRAACQRRHQQPDRRRQRPDCRGHPRSTGGIDVAGNMLAAIDRLSEQEALSALSLPAQLAFGLTDGCWVGSTRTTAVLVGSTVAARGDDDGSGASAAHTCLACCASADLLSEQVRCVCSRCRPSPRLG